MQALVLLCNLYKIYLSLSWIPDYHYTVQMFNIRGEHEDACMYVITDTSSLAEVVRALLLPMSHWHE